MPIFSERVMNDALGSFCFYCRQKKEGMDTCKKNTWLHCKACHRREHWEVKIAGIRITKAYDLGWNIDFWNWEGGKGMYSGYTFPLWKSGGQQKWLWVYVVSQQRIVFRIMNLMARIHPQGHIMND